MRRFASPSASTSPSGRLSPALPWQPPVTLRTATPPRRPVVPVVEGKPRQATLVGPDTYREAEFCAQCGHVLIEDAFFQEGSNFCRICGDLLRRAAPLAGSKASSVQVPPGCRAAGTLPPAAVTQGGSVSVMSLECCTTTRGATAESPVTKSGSYVAPYATVRGPSPVRRVASSSPVRRMDSSATSLPTARIIKPTTSSDESSASKRRADEEASTRAEMRLELKRFKEEMTSTESERRAKTAEAVAALQVAVSTRREELPALGQELRTEMRQRDARMQVRLESMERLSSSQAERIELLEGRMVELDSSVRRRLEEHKCGLEQHIRNEIEVECASRRRLEESLQSQSRELRVTQERLSGEILALKAMDQQLDFDGPMRAAIREDAERIAERIAERNVGTLRTEVERIAERIAERSVGSLRTEILHAEGPTRTALRDDVERVAERILNSLRAELPGLGHAEAVLKLREDLDKHRRDGGAALERLTSRFEEQLPLLDSRLRELHEQLRPELEESRRAQEMAKGHHNRLHQRLADISEELERQAKCLAKSRDDSVEACRALIIDTKVEFKGFVDKQSAEQRRSLAAALERQASAQEERAREVREKLAGLRSHAEMYGSLVPNKRLEDLAEQMAGLKNSVDEAMARDRASRKCLARLEDRVTNMYSALEDTGASIYASLQDEGALFRRSERQALTATAD